MSRTFNADSQVRIALMHRKNQRKHLTTAYSHSQDMCPLASHPRMNLLQMRKNCSKCLKWHRSIPPIRCLQVEARLVFEWPCWYLVGALLKAAHLKAQEDTCVRRMCMLNTLCVCTVPILTKSCQPYCECNDVCP